MVTVQRSLCSAELSEHPFPPYHRRTSLSIFIRLLRPMIMHIRALNLIMTGQSFLFQPSPLDSPSICKSPNLLHGTNRESLSPCARTASLTSLMWITGFSPAHDVSFVLSIQTHPLLSHRLLLFHPHLYYDIHFVFNLVPPLQCYRPLHTSLLHRLLILQNSSPPHQLWTKPSG